MIILITNLQNYNKKNKIRDEEIAGSKCYRFLNKLASGRTKIDGRKLTVDCIL